MSRRLRRHRRPPLEVARARALARFRRARPLRAGSLLITILGDAISPRGGTVALASLIRLAAPFGLSERHVRTAVGRLAQDGWLKTRRRGRLSFYALTADGRRRFKAATRRIYSGTPVSWDGVWLTVYLTARASTRFKQELAFQGFGQVRVGVLARPARPGDGSLAVPAARGVVVWALGGSAATDRQLVAAGWDLVALGARYRRFLGHFRPVRAALHRQRRVTPETGFVLRTLLIHEFRKVHLRDPLLPARLLPKPWVGNAAYALCRALYARVFAAAEAHLTATARTSDGALPRPARGVYARFGGMPRASAPRRRSSRRPRRGRRARGSST